MRLAFLWLNETGYLLNDERDRVFCCHELGEYSIHGRGEPIESHCWRNLRALSFQRNRIQGKVDRYDSDAYWFFGHSLGRSMNLRELFPLKASNLSCLYRENALIIRKGKTDRGIKRTEFLTDSVICFLPIQKHGHL